MSNMIVLSFYISIMIITIAVGAYSVYSSIRKPMNSSYVVTSYIIGMMLTMMVALLMHYLLKEICIALICVIAYAGL